MGVSCLSAAGLEHVTSKPHLAELAAARGFHFVPTTVLPSATHQVRRSLAASHESPQAQLPADPERCERRRRRPPVAEEAFLGVEAYPERMVTSV